jgi:hypothetical protein
LTCSDASSLAMVAGAFNQGDGGVNRSAPPAGAAIGPNSRG